MYETSFSREFTKSNCSTCQISITFFKYRVAPKVESLIGLTQRMVSTKVDLATRTLLTTRILEASDREVARMASLSLPQTGTWLNCPPLPALRLRPQALSLLLPPSLSWECLIKLGQATASVN